VAATPGQPFAWPKRVSLRALQTATIAIPAAVLNDQEVMGSVIHADDDVQVNLPTGANSPDEAHIFIRIHTGQRVWLEKSCQAIVVPERQGDLEPRYFEVDCTAFGL